MVDLNILFLDRKGEGVVGAAQTRHEFEQEVAKHCNCKFAGEGFPLHRANETMDETVKRVMPDADWVIDKDNNLHNKKPENRRYKVGHFTSDLHAKHFYKAKNPVSYARLLNEANYDALFMRYLYVYGTRYDYRCVYDAVECEKHWVPWSVDPERYQPLSKDINVSFLGTVNRVYPLRVDMWRELEKVAKGYNVVKRRAPSGKTYDRTVAKLKDDYLVGEDYQYTLAKTQIMLFDCSVYRYQLQKYTQGAAAGCLVMSDEPSMAKYSGLIDGETYVKVTREDWKQKLRYYLDNPVEGKKVASRGRFNVLANHTHEIRAKQWVEMLT